MWFQVDGFHESVHAGAIARAVRARDPNALVKAEAQGVRIVAGLDLRRMLEALAEAGVAAIPECRLARPGAPLTGVLRGSVRPV